MIKLSRALVAIGLATTQIAGVASATPVAPDIKTSLSRLPDVQVVSEGKLNGARTFELTINQPVDHDRPNAGLFKQRMTLVHRGTRRPTVLHTTGYGVRAAELHEPAKLVDGNEISVEQRYFTPSRPDPADWTHLNIWQAANDHHRIVMFFKTLYTGRWLSTGVSKGGMTSIYHRRFFPDDVDGTIAYGAPNDIDNDSDDNYTRFIATAGDDPKCNRRLERVQRRILEHPDKFVATLKSYRYTYTSLGGAEQALELATRELQWSFWQRKLQQDCATVPDDEASSDDVWKFFVDLADKDTNSDTSIAKYLPYYYQACGQLGWPTTDESVIKDLLRYPELTGTCSIVAADIRPRTFDTKAMADIDNWVQDEGSNLMFVYGQNDPWSAEPFRLGKGTTDSFHYTVPGGNHGSAIGDLPAAEQRQAAAAVRRWAGVATS